VVAFAEDLKPRFEAVAKVAAAHADAVDRDARFPGEAFEAARKARLLSLLVPTELGGDGGTVSDHFSSTFDLATASGEVAHTACVAFGMDRLALALFATHGLDTGRWPKEARESLGL
jgi:acyl-CoA dehydrogenase